MGEKHDGGEHILIVDDLPDNLRLLNQILSERAYHVRAVTSGERALASVRLDPPALILLDIKMNGMDGFAVCQALKADAATAGIPVIFISALADLGDKLQAFKTGGVDYITKPFQYEEVVARVETHLTLARLQHQLEQANQKMMAELALAGEVQASFLPQKLPEVPGWQFSVTLQPARETSGDYFDLFPLPDGRWGLLIADVVDKGVSAALFMSLSYALFRSYVERFPAEPDRVFCAMNQHILNDTKSNQFVSVFFGILDPADGRLLYSNAGHPPPLRVDGNGWKESRWLGPTGAPLGIMEDCTWTSGQVTMTQSEVLVLYTDGLIEAENKLGELYGRDRLLAKARALVRKPAVDIKEEIIREVCDFVGEEQLLDDMVLFVVRRD